MRDAEATRARILTAAIEEFGEHGLAGGRVDRIARSAESNVRMIYAYFDGKTGLFDAALENALRRLAEEAPLTPQDLPGWAGALFDHHEEHPSILRLSIWAQLERPSALTEPLDIYGSKTTALAPNTAPPLSPVDVLIFVHALAQAWELAPSGLTDSAADPSRRATHRRALVAAVERMLRTG